MKFKSKQKIFIHENAFENDICEMTTILSRGDEFICNKQALLTQSMFFKTLTIDTHSSSIRMSYGVYAVNFCLISNDYLHFCSPLYFQNTYQAKLFYESMSIIFPFPLKTCYEGGSLCKHRLTLIPAWINNYNHCKSVGWIAYPLPNFNDETIEVWKWISNFISHSAGNVITIHARP